MKRRKTGLSPRLRGNLKSSPFNPVSARSIPAPTGKPFASPPAKSNGQVYPRAYGETDQAVPLGLDLQGLSPRLRGNQLTTPGGIGKSRSIPAPTGKPGPEGRLSRLAQVYPRAYGETHYYGDDCPGGHGLSPRLRGNPEPAYGKISLTPVYPRAYGETGRPPGRSRPPAQRSIPAPTGKPRPRGL